MRVRAHSHSSVRLYTKTDNDKLYLIPSVTSLLGHNQGIRFFHFDRDVFEMKLYNRFNGERGLINLEKARHAIRGNICHLYLEHYIKGGFYKDLVSPNLEINSVKFDLISKDLIKEILKVNPALFAESHDDVKILLELELCLKNLAEFIFAKNYQWVYSERYLTDIGEGMAGTVDACYYDDELGGYVIFDLKTSKSVHNYKSNFHNQRLIPKLTQTYAYGKMLANELGIEIKAYEILSVTSSRVENPKIEYLDVLNENFVNKYNLVTYEDVLEFQKEKFYLMMENGNTQD